MPSSSPPQRAASFERAAEGLPVVRALLWPDERQIMPVAINADLHDAHAVASVEHALGRPLVQPLDCTSPSSTRIEVAQGHVARRPPVYSVTVVEDGVVEPLSVIA